jgi:hypothetical protein
LIGELGYEKRVATGLLRYTLGGQPTGTVEHWRVTTAPDGYTFLRVDLDSRESDSGNSYLYHLLMGPDGLPERLTYQFFGRTALTVKGNVLFEADRLVHHRETNGVHRDEEMAVSAETRFFFPTTHGLSLLTRRYVSGLYNVHAVTLNMYGEDDHERFFALMPLTIELVPYRHLSEFTLMGRTIVGHPFSITWPENHRHLDVDKHHVPLSMQRNDGLTATETRYMRYGNE